MIDLKHNRAKKGIVRRQQSQGETNAFDFDEEDLRNIRRAVNRYIGEYQDARDQGYEITDEDEADFNKLWDLYHKVWDVTKKYYKKPSKPKWEKNEY